MVNFSEKRPLSDLTKGRLLLAGLLAFSRLCVIPISAIATDDASDSSETSCSQAAAKLRESPTSPDATRTKEWYIHQSELYQSAIKLCPSMAEAYYNLGIIQIREKDFASGLENLKKAQEKKPENVNFSAAYATAALESGDRNLAESLYRAVLRKDPHSTKALQGLSVIAERAGDLDQAVKHLLDAEKEDPNDAVTLFNLGLLREKQNSFDSAISAYEKLIRLHPSHAQASMRLASILIDKELFDEAQQILTKIIELSPRNVEALKLSAMLQNRLDDKSKAILSLRRALDIEPDNKKIAIALAKMLLDQGSTDDARRVVERMLQKVPDDTNLLNLGGQISMGLGDFNQAEESFRKGLALNALDASLHYNFSVLLKRMGRLKESEQQYQAALKIDPEIARRIQPK